MLEQKGIRVESESVRAKLEGVPGIRLGEGRAFLAPTTVADVHRRLFASRPVPEEGPFTLRMTDHASYLWDWDGTLRLLTVADNDRYARLADALRDKGFVGAAPGLPGNVPERVRGLSMLISSAKNNRGAPVYVANRTLEEELYAREMLEALGRDQSLSIHLISPLRFAGDEVEIALALHKKYRDAPAYIGNMPIMAVSTPAAVVSAFVVSVAEILGGSVIADVLGIHVGGASANVYPCDMRTMSLCFGTPPNIAVSALEAEINREIFRATRDAKAFRTMAQHPGPQAAAQRAMCAGAMAEQGRRMLSGAGSLSLDEGFSPEMLMLDVELFQAIRKAHETIEDTFLEDFLLIESILENTEDFYANTDETVLLYPKFQPDPGFFTAYQLQQWIERGRPDIREAMRNEADRLVAENDFALDEDLSRELDTLYAHALKRLGG